MHVRTYAHTYTYLPNAHKRALSSTCNSKSHATHVHLYHFQMDLLMRVEPGLDLQTTFTCASRACVLSGLTTRVEPCSGVGSSHSLFTHRICVAVIHVQLSHQAAEHPHGQSPLGERLKLEGRVHLPQEDPQGEVTLTVLLSQHHCTLGD